jgi:hypothetical protein
MNKVLYFVILFMCCGCLSTNTQPQTKSLSNWLKKLVGVNEKSPPSPKYDYDDFEALFSMLTIQFVMNFLLGIIIIKQYLKEKDSNSKIK